jgi:5-oxopent-3-ene-1,2,5-tricarboxylate decarboxylase / 2-hydroxyhepta-2,4-diene-1,7-dioate isomerase
MEKMKMTKHPLLKGKLICVALNDQNQLDTLESTFNEAPYLHTPKEPVLYFKPRNTWNGDKATLTPPTQEDHFVVGASLAVVIGKECCRVSENDAMDYAAGFSILHDISLPEKNYYRPDIKGKCIDGTAPLLETMVDANTFGDVSALQVITSVNGQEKASLSLSNLHRSVPTLIETISRIMTLNAGDVIGVGFIGERIPLCAGDEIMSNIDGVGCLTTLIGGAK